MKELRDINPVNLDKARFVAKRTDFLQGYTFKKGYDENGVPIVGNSATKKTEFYDELKATYPNLEKYANGRIKRVIKEFNRLLVHTAVGHRDGIQLPMRAGSIVVAIFGKSGHKAIPNVTGKVQKELHYQNDHSEGFSGGVYYTAHYKKEFAARSREMFPNSKFWLFKPSRYFNRLIAQEMKRDWRQFWFLPPNRKLREMNKAHNMNNRMKILRAMEKANYNEFDLND